MWRNPAHLALLLALLAVAGVSFSRADLPVHCIHSQIEGRWQIFMTNNYPEPQSCGHQYPDRNKDHLFSVSESSLKFPFVKTLTLGFPNRASDDHGNTGTWTMVYDEGFEFTLKNTKYFAFSKYVPKVSAKNGESTKLEDYTSICSETLIGWYHNLQDNLFGCYYAKQIEAFSKDQSGSGDSLAHQISQDQSLKILSPTAMKPPPLPTSAPSHLFEPDFTFIEMVNSNKDLTWTAGVHKQFLGKTVQEMSRMVGRSKYSKQMTRMAVQDNRPDEIKYDGLPEQIDYRNHNGVNYDTVFRDQGNCGSCYIFAPLSVIETRYRVKHNNEQLFLSAQEILSCSQYNQGCDGGYPYLVAKHVQEYGILQERCWPYAEAEQACPSYHRDLFCDNKDNRIRIKSYGYIGGYYGACSEVAMMRELVENGPFVTAMMVPNSLFYYKNGIFNSDSARPKTEGPTMPGMHAWEETNHSVLLIGYGVDHETNQKYWIAKNSWGKDWGENGYFRIRRGTDECAVESMALALHL